MNANEAPLLAGSFGDRVERFAAVVPLLAVAIVYANALSAPFVWDDHWLIENQPCVTALCGPRAYFGSTFWADPLDEVRSYYRPLVTLSYAIEWQLWAGSPAGFHLTNVLLHAAVVGLLYALARKFGARRLPASAAVLLFAVFPRLTESVTWISGRTDVLAALFGLSSVLAFGDGGSSRRRWLSSGLLLCGLLSKEVAIAFAIGLSARQLFAKRGKVAFRQLAEVAVAIAAYSALRAFALADVAVPQLANVGAAPEFGARVFAALAAVGTYARMVFDPLRPQIEIGSLRSPGRFETALGGLLLAAGAIFFWRKRAALRERTVFAITAGAVAVALVVHLVPLGMSGIAADRYLYIPMAMAALVLSWSLQVLPAHRSVGAWAVISLLTVSFAIATSLRNRDWADEYRLWKGAVARRDASNPRPLFALAAVLMDAELYERALPYLEQAVHEQRAAPELGTYNAKAVALDKSGRRNEAISLFTRMAAQQPNAGRVKLNLSMSHARDARFAEALRVLNEIPDHAVPRSTVDAVRKLIRRAEATLSGRSLRVRPDEPVDEVGARAAVADELGARPEAQALYELIAATRTAPPEHRLKAAAYMAFHGDPPRARAVMAQVKGSVAAADEFALLEEALTERDAMR